MDEESWLMKKLKDNYIWIILVVSLIMLLSLITIVSIKKKLVLDEKIYGIVSKYLINDNITPIEKAITFLASTPFFIGFALFLFFYDKK